jgi:hypothetical protein
MIVSFFDSMKSSLTKQIEFKDYIKMVRKGIDDQHVKKIIKLQKLVKADPKRYKLMKETLPIITPHAIVNGKRQDQNVKQHSGIVSVDIDLKNNDPADINNFDDPRALAWHRTVSGEGLVVYYRMNAGPTTHHSAFQTIADRLKEKFNLNADPHVKALSVPRFIAYDPKVKFNPQAPVIKFDPTAAESSEQETAAGSKESDQEQLRELTKQIVKEKVGIVNDRESWVKMAAVFCRTFDGNEEGLKLFDKISQLSDKYKSIKDCEKVYRSFIGKKGVKEATIGSLIYLMEQEGMEVDTGQAGGHLTHFEDDPEEETKASWRDYLLTEEPEDEVPLVRFGEINICTQGNHSLVIGKKKSRKSLFITYLVSLFENKKNIDKKILIADTEQGKKHVWKMMQRLRKLTGKKMNVLYLRGENPEKRMKIIKAALKDMQPDMLVIDGIRDLLYDINDPKECTKVVTWVEKMTLTGLHIVNVLHLNKTDGNARGHIGSELLNKAETVMELELMQDGEITAVKCEASRDIPFEPFGFTHDMHGLPVLVDLPSKDGIKMDENSIIERLKAVFSEKEQLTNPELRKAIQIAFECGQVKAKKLMTQLMKDDYIGTKGQPHTPNQRYYFKG